MYVLFHRFLGVRDHSNPDTWEIRKFRIPSILLDEYLFQPNETNWVFMGKYGSLEKARFAKTRLIAKLEARND